jgi:hypothetical protein
VTELEELQAELERLRAKMGRYGIKDKEYDVSTLHGRLGWAIQRHGSVRAFQLAMEKRKVKGVSTGAIYRYLKGEVEPGLAFLTVVGEELRVRPAWLAFGDGEP